MNTVNRRSAWLLLTAALLASGPTEIVSAEQSVGTGFRLTESGQQVSGQAILLAIDEMALPLRRNLCLYLAKPAVRKAPVLIPSRDNPNAPDFMAAQFYGAVLHDQGKFRMWYYAIHPKPGLKDLIEGPVCYAESQDGLEWTKPHLGQVMFQGNKENNVVGLPGERAEGVAVIRDDADPDPQRRYKMIYNIVDPSWAWTLRTATSADGFRWTVGPERPIRSFLEFCSLYQHRGRFIVNSQVFGYGEGGRPQGRQAYAWVSPDFDHWLQEPALSFALPEPKEGTGLDGRYDQVHLGVAGCSLGNVVVGLYARWHQRGWGIGGTTCDLCLVLSQDGIHFYEPVRDHIYISHQDSPVTPVPGKDYPTILIQANGVLNYGEETRIYHGRWRNVNYPSDEALDYWGEVALATLPRDRWGALGLVPDGAEGAAWSTPVQLPAREFSLWLNAEGARGITVELADEQFRPLPEFSGENAGRAEREGGLDCQVTWPSKSMASLRGKVIRLRINLHKQGPATPRLFAIYLRE
jgi:hypothetical protein